MAIKKITAIFDELHVEKVANALEAHGVKGFTVHPVKGRGSYCNTFSRNHLVRHTQIEIYTAENHAKKIARLLMKVAHVGADSEGLVAITSVDELNWIFQQKQAVIEDFNYFEVENG